MVAKTIVWFEWFGLPAFVALLVVILLAVTGCATIPPQDRVPNLIPAVGTNLNKTDAFITSAENATQAAVKHADVVGQEDLKQVSTSHKAAQASNAAAVKDLAAVSKERDTLKQTAADAQADAAKYKDSWGYKAEVWITRFAVMLAILIGIHYLAGAAVIVITMFFPAAIVAVPIIKIVGTVVNPLAWFQFLVDHVHCSNTVATAAATPVTSTVQAIRQVI